MSSIPEFLRPELFRNPEAIFQAKRYNLPAELEQKLTPSEKECLGRLSKVADLVENLFQKQKTTPFYPEGMTEDELQNLAAENPAVLNLSTYVERSNGQIVTIPFNQRFPDKVRRIAGELKAIPRSFKAQDYYQSQLPSSQRFQSVAEAFLHDTWVETERKWLDSPWNNRVEFLIAPIETHLDPLYHKAAYQAVVGVEDEKISREIDDFITLAGYHQAKPFPQIKVKTLYLIANGGISAERGWNAQALSNDPKLTEQFGSRISIYLNPFEETFEQRLLPIIQGIFEESLTRKFTKEELRMAALKWLALHEVSHPLNQVPGQKERLGLLYDPFHELHCDVSALHLAITLRECNLLKPEEFEAILLIHFARKLNDIARSEFGSKDAPDPYALGSKVELNYLALRTEFVSESGEFDFRREDAIIRAIGDLMGIFNYFALSKDVSRGEVAGFFAKYEPQRTYQPASLKLKDLYQVKA